MEYSDILFNFHHKMGQDLVEASKYTYQNWELGVPIESSRSSEDDAFSQMFLRIRSIYITIYGFLDVPKNIC